MQMFGLIFAGVGALMALIGLFLVWHRIRFLRHAVSAQGTVVDLVERMTKKSRENRSILRGLVRRATSDGIAYSPLVEFTTPQGQSVRFVESASQSPPKWQPGDHVPVRYRPEDPQGARIPSAFGLWYGPAFTLVFGAIFLGAGIPIYLAAPDGSSGVPGAGNTNGRTTITVQVGSGKAETQAVRCLSIRDSKGPKGREIQLRVKKKTLTFMGRPYTGPGAYIPGQNLRVGGTLLKGDGTPTGAVVFDASGKAGGVNLIAGGTSANGEWDCSGVKIRGA